MNFDTADRDEVLAWASEMERSDVIKREMDIRRMALEAAEYEPHYPLPPWKGVVCHPSTATFIDPLAIPPASHATYVHVTVDIPSYIHDHDMRVILAEKIIRQQLGVDAP